MHSALLWLTCTVALVTSAARQLRHTINSTSMTSGSWHAVRRLWRDNVRDFLAEVANKQWNHVRGRAPTVTSQFTVRVWRHNASTYDRACATTYRPGSWEFGGRGGDVRGGRVPCPLLPPSGWPQLQQPPHGGASSSLQLLRRHGDGGAIPAGSWLVTAGDVIDDVIGGRVTWWRVYWRCCQPWTCYELPSCQPHPACLENLWGKVNGKRLNGVIFIVAKFLLLSFLQTYKFLLYNTSPNRTA